MDLHKKGDFGGLKVIGYVIAVTLLFIAVFLIVRKIFIVTSPG